MQTNKRTNKPEQRNVVFLNIPAKFQKSKESTTARQTLSLRVDCFVHTCKKLKLGFCVESYLV